HDRGVPRSRPPARALPVSGPLVRSAGADAARNGAALGRARDHRRGDRGAPPRERLLDPRHDEPEPDLQARTPHDGKGRGVLHAAGSHRPVDDAQSRHRRHARQAVDVCEGRPAEVGCVGAAAAARGRRDRTGEEVIVRAIAVACVAIAAAYASAMTDATHGASPSDTPPAYEVDPFWPKPLPNHWILGSVAGVAVDRRDHVWLTHRPSTLQPNETRSIWKAAPPVLEFDAEGNLVSSWGGPGEGYEWPQLEHGIYVDARDRVWLGGGGDKDAQILAFTRQGRFLLQIGH